MFDSFSEISFTSFSASFASFITFVLVDVVFSLFFVFSVLLLLVFSTPFTLPLLFTLPIPFSVLFIFILLTSSALPGFDEAPAIVLRCSDSFIISSAKRICEAGSILFLSMHLPSEARLSRARARSGTARKNPAPSGLCESTVLVLLQILPLGEGLCPLNDTVSSELCLSIGTFSNVYGLFGCSRQRSTNNRRLSLVTSNSNPALVDATTGSGVFGDGVFVAVVVVVELIRLFMTLLVVGVCGLRASQRCL